MARVRPRPIPRSNVATSCPVSAKVSRTRLNSALKAAAIPVVCPRVSSSASTCASRSSNRSTSSILFFFWGVREIGHQGLKPRPPQGRDPGPGTQHQLQLRRRQRPELMRPQAQPTHPRLHQGGPIKARSAHAPSGAMKARASNSAAARAAPMAPPSISALNRSLACPRQPPPRSPATMRRSTSRLEKAPLSKRSTISTSDPPSRLASSSAKAPRVSFITCRCPSIIRATSPAKGFAIGSRRRKGQLPRRGQRQLIGRLAIMGARIFNRTHLKRPLDHPEIRDHHLKIRGLPVKENLPCALVTRFVAENPRPADRGRFDASPRQQLAPAARAFKAGHIHAFRVETDARRPQARHRLKIAVAGQVDLDQKVFAILNCHGPSPV